MKVLAITVLALAAGEVPNLRGTPSEASEKPDDHAVEEPSMVALESVGVAGATCEKWVTCKDGFFGNIRCSGSRYCEVWGPAPVPHGATCKKWVMVSSATSVAAVLATVKFGVPHQCHMAQPARSG
ncbi:unnamed protein product [Effrenium voratum]|uniref:Uncharacterized protein n=1 Tax=Effrenium voratum TaxID=2562239 RepID=A0AA36MY20_9DINO|nr:unnamed protein product [Effrenium voratum]